MLGNGVMAIASGLAGSWLVQGLGLGPVAPFDAAIVVRGITNRPGLGVTSSQGGH